MKQAKEEVKDGGAVSATAPTDPAVVAPSAEPIATSGMGGFLLGSTCGMLLAALSVLAVATAWRSSRRGNEAKKVHLFGNVGA